ncbi:uncharacterized protein LOC103315742 [Nasonia vitripennis]|uniref:Mab-21-like nucleotidyltransferase domain-containing protein n=1 Tax=Nasonia vitripennis TaxID=7425 RepID=A0A7M7Q1H0_NASVI|nr:uncharacterized protein LOC103315742 [Nasonia vitripennis]
MAANSPVNIIQKLHDGKFYSDEMFHKISAKYIRINRNELQLSNQILRNVVLTMLLKHMKKEDKFFNDLFGDVNYAGSVSKNLKVYKPDEYDLNLVIRLPINYKFLTIEPDDIHCGYVKIRAKVADNGIDAGIFSRIISGNYLDQNKFREWMHSVVRKALNSIHSESNSSVDNNSNLYIFRSRKRTYEVTCRQSNPAFTLQVIYKAANYNVDFDLVPCLQFKNKAVEGFRQPKGNQWIAIAKPLRVYEGNLLWRAGFYQTEKRLLKGSIVGQIKPIIKMFKKFRDDQGWDNIKSYYIETLFYNELTDKDFKRDFCYFSCTSVFVYMLQRLEKHLKAKVLRNYWHKEHSLFDSVNPQYLEDLARQLEKI